jgi:hypothetical protein
MDLRKDVRDDAARFIIKHEEIFKQALLDGKSEAHDIDYDHNGEFHEDVVDRAYTLQDAAFIVENCDELEEDRGLWEGLEPIEAVKAQAAWSYGNDVHAEVKRLYEELFEKFEDIRDDLDDRHSELQAIQDDHAGSGPDGTLTLEEDTELQSLGAALDELAADSAWQWLVNRGKLEPCVPGSDDEAFVLRTWLRLNEQAGLRGGYPLGGSYIDARCGVGYGMPDQKDYVDFDDMAGKRVPHLYGANREQVEAYVKKTWPPKKRRAR